jgi:hypothetical protein
MQFQWAVHIGRHFLIFAKVSYLTSLHAWDDEWTCPIFVTWNGQGEGRSTAYTVQFYCKTVALRTNLSSPDIDCPQLVQDDAVPIWRNFDRTFACSWRKDLIGMGWFNRCRCVLWNSSNVFRIMKCSLHHTNLGCLRFCFLLFSNRSNMATISSSSDESMSVSGKVQVTSELYVNRQKNDTWKMKSLAWDMGLESFTNITRCLVTRMYIWHIVGGDGEGWSSAVQSVLITCAYIWPIFLNSYDT